MQKEISDAMEGHEGQLTQKAGLANTGKNRLITLLFQHQDVAEIQKNSGFTTRKVLLLATRRDVRHNQLVTRRTCTLSRCCWIERVIQTQGIYFESSGNFPLPSRSTSPDCSIKCQLAAHSSMPVCNLSTTAACCRCLLSFLDFIVLMYRCICHKSVTRGIWRSSCFGSPLFI